MNTETKKLAGIATSALLIGAGSIYAMPQVVHAQPAPQAIDRAAESGVPAQDEVAPVVQGTFSYDQGATSSNQTISDMFCKAAAVLCTAMPQYGINAVNAITVTGPDGTSFAATVNEMAADEDATAYTIACACASNVAGGGAIINANVAGISLASLAAMAGA